MTAWLPLSGLIANRAHGERRGAGPGEPKTAAALPGLGYGRALMRWMMEASGWARGTDVVVSPSLSGAVMIWVWRLYLQLVGRRPLSGRAARTASGGTRPRTREVKARLPPPGLTGGRARDARGGGGPEGPKTAVGRPGLGYGRA